MTGASFGDRERKESPPPATATEAVEALQALVMGESDALVGRTASGPRVFTLVDAREQLIESEHRFKVALGNSPTAVFEQDLDLRYTWIFNAKLGYRAQEVIGRSDAETMDASCAPRIEAIKREVIRSGQPIRAEVQAAAPGAPLGTYDLYVEPRRDAAGRTIGVVCAATDITERIKQEAALRDIDQRFRALVNATSDVVYRMSPDWSEMRQLDGHGFIQDTPSPSVDWLTEYIHPDDQPLVIRTIDEAIRTKSVFSLEHRVRRTDGTLGWTFSRAIPLLNDSGEIVEWFGAASDVTARRRAELALKESEQRLRRLYESGLLGVIYWDTDGEITDANDKFLEMVGYTREEMRAGGIDWQNMTPPEFRHLDEASVRELQATGVNAAPFEKEYIRKDGSRISILLAGAMTDEARRNGVAFVLDVTERKRAEAALRQSERTLRLFIERAPVALAMFDRDMRCIHASPRWLSDYGLDRDVTGVSLYEVFPEIPKRWREIHRRALAGETIRAEEDRFLRANGEEQWLRWEVRPWRTSEDEVGGVILFSEDITTRKHAERQIAESEARYRALVDSAAAAIVVIDDKGIIHSVNPAVTTIFGYDPQELVGASVSILMPEDVARAHKDIEAYLRPGVVTKIIGTGREVVGRHRDGSLVDVHLTVAEWRDSQGKRFFVGRMNSIAERKRVEAELSDSRRMEAVGRLAAAVAHDSNNLLAVIVGNLALIDERVEDDGLRRLVRPALEAAEAGAALNRRLVSMSGQRQFKRAPLAVNDTVRDFASLLRSALGEQIVLELDLAEGLWKCIADRGEVHNALLNLATNARDASPRGGLVTIRTRNATIELMTAGSLQGARAGDYVSLSVADNGQGMAPEVLERALEPFFSTKADGKGVGLGLSGVHAFVRDAGGFVTIESREGMGTTVSLYLPRAPVATPTPAEAGAVEDVPLGDGEVVLVVEDDDQVRDVTLKRVEALGYVAEAARTGSEAVDMLKAGLRVDLVLSDIMMPGGMSGHDLARWVRREAPAVGVVLATGYDREVAQGEGAARDVPVLFKPYTRGELASALVMALDKTRL